MTEFHIGIELQASSECKNLKLADVTLLPAMQSESLWVADKLTVEVVYIACGEYLPLSECCVRILFVYRVQHPM